MEIIEPAHRQPRHAPHDELVEQLSLDLSRKGYLARTIGIKLRHDDFSTTTRDLTLDAPTCEARLMRHAAGQCLKRADLTRRMRLLGIRGGPDRTVTEEEIAASLVEGLDAGVIEAQEHQMVRNVFRLDERQIGSMMIPRAEITWLDAEAPLVETLALMAEHRHTRYPVCRGDLTDVVGVLAAQSLLPAIHRFDPAVHLPQPDGDENVEEARHAQ